jgi:hypothetical protein
VAPVIIVSAAARGAEIAEIKNPPSREFIPCQAVINGSNRQLYGAPRRSAAAA